MRQGDGGVSVAGLCGRRHRSDDAGATLIELVVTVSVMAVLGAIFLTGVTQMYGSANHTEATSRAQSELTLASMRIGTVIRYAAAVTTSRRPVLGDWYAEFQTSNVTTSSCTRLRLSASSGALQMISWTSGQTPGTNWTTLVTNLIVPTEAQVTAATYSAPFTVLRSGVSSGTQRLRLVLTGHPAGTQTAALNRLDVAFALLNSKTSNGSVCQEGRPKSP